MADQPITNIVAAQQLGEEMSATQEPPKIPIPGFPASDPSMVAQTWYETNQSGSGSDWLNNVDENVNSSDKLFFQKVPIVALSWWSSLGNWEAISVEIENHPDWPLSQVWALVTRRDAAQMWSEVIAAFEVWCKSQVNVPHPLPCDPFNAWIKGERHGKEE